MTDLMTPAERYGLATAMADQHASRCRHCGPPSVDRSTAGCPNGRALEQSWLRHRLAHLAALTERGPR